MKYVNVCIASGGKGGTGKTTFATVLSYVWKNYGVSVSLSTPLRRAGGGVNVVDFPTFQTTDVIYVESLLKCHGVIYVVEEDVECVKAVDQIHVIAKRDVWGVVVNKVFAKPSKLFQKLYGRLGPLYVVHFDEKLAMHRAVGMSPHEVRSRAVLEMGRAAVDILKFKFGKST